MNEKDGVRRRERWVVALAFLVLAGAALGIAGRDLQVPGLNYDEVVQAEPALQFLAEDGRPSKFPGARTTRLFGGWFPILIQPYMGALKSHLLIPTFAIFGANAASLRLSTLLWSLAGLAFAMVFARNLMGTRVALVSGALLAADPSFLFISRHDWGSFALAFLCRCAGLALLARGWSGGSALRLFAGGLCFGLGVYNKIDFGVFVAASALALVLARPRTIAEAAESRGLRPAPALVGFVLGAGPMIATARAVFSTARNVVGRQSGGSGDWAEKLNTLVTMLDGSYFDRLMLAGGNFERMFDAGGATGLFLVAVAASVLALGFGLARDRRRDELDRAEAFAWLACLAITAGMFLTPRAVRIHHTLYSYPFPHLVVAIVFVRLWDGRLLTGAAPGLRRGGAAVALAAVLATNLAVDFGTLATLRESGGKGRWSDGIDAFARELAAQPGTIAVSLDWGFDGPLRFAARELPTEEPIWALRYAHMPGHAWQYTGGPEHVYLVFEEDLAVFEHGPRFLAMVRDLEAEDVTVRRHLDREGDLAFVSVRFARPHRLRYEREFEVELQ